MICLTFDTDHLDERRMLEFLELVPVPGRATFFCTQRYECLERSGHELGPHTLLEGPEWEHALQRSRAEFPQAVGWRSHSCGFSHLTAVRLHGLGFRYVSIYDEPGRPRPVPYRQAWGLWQMPIYYMDNLDFSMPRFWPDAPEPFDRSLIDRAVANDGVYVFGFHPIHLLLNSPDPDTYFELRDGWNRGEPVSSLRHTGYGAMSFYEDLLAAMPDDTGSVALADALDAYVENESLTASS